MRLRIYRWVHRLFFEPIAEAVAFQKWGSDRSRELARVPEGPGTVCLGQEPHFNSHVWFHAASVGELESLWTVIEAWIEKGGRVSVSIFSKSAEKSLAKLKTALAQRSSQIVYFGYSPWEGRWGDFLKRYSPDVFVTAKYEAWPELWLSLAHQEVPLVIVGAKKRSSYRFAQRMCGLLGGQIPRIHFLSVSSADADALADALKDRFEAASVRVIGEPRWDRVSRRLENSPGNSEVAKIVKDYELLPKPWGVLGSAWIEDLQVWKDSLREFLGKEASGTLWVVPHRIDPSYLAQVERFLGEQGFEISRSSLGFGGFEGFGGFKGFKGFKQGAGKPVVLIDQMGFLAELYSYADWAYVGGGFGKGVHSTIEPALQAIPIAVGPARIESFSEISQLKEAGILSVVNNAQELKTWVSRVRGLRNTEGGDALRVKWREEISKKLGATQGVVSVIEEIVRVKRK